MTRIIRFCSISIFSIIVPTILAAQIPALADMKQKYPDDDLVYLLLDEHLFIVVGEEGLKIKSIVQRKNQILDASLGGYQLDYVYYDSFSEINDLAAETQIPLGKKSKTARVVDIETQDVMVGGIFYSDLKRKKIAYPEVSEGAVTSLVYTESFSEPRLLSSFAFQRFAPVEVSRFSYTYQADRVKMGWVIHKDRPGVLSHKKVEKDGFITETWEARNQPALPIEPNAPDAGHFTTTIVPYVQAYKVGNEWKPLLKGPDELYDWYYSLVADQLDAKYPALDSLSNALTQGAGSDRDKAARIFQWVQSNVQYIAYEDGMGGFVPRTAEAVCTKKYGDCKDMANLLRYLLRAAGLDGRLAWIGTRDKPYRYEEVSTPVVDNHMIAALQLNGQWIFLDATGKYTPFGLPTPMIQGKQALIEQSADDYALVEVPIIAAERNIRTDSIVWSISGTDLRGEGLRHLTGFQKLDLEGARQQTPANVLPGFWKSHLERGSNRFYLENPEAILPTAQADTALLIPFVCDLPAYAQQVGNRLFINVQFDKSWQNALIDTTKRTLPIEYDYAHIWREKNILSIPAGYTVSFLPEDVQLQEPDFGFSISYQVKDNKIIMEKTAYINTLLLQPLRFAAWNKMVQALVKANKNTIVCTK